MLANVALLSIGEADRHSLMHLDFRRLRDARDLPDYLGCAPKLVDRVRGAADAELFVVHQIPKKGAGGGTREVWEVRDRDIAVVYKALNRSLDAFFREAVRNYPHACAHAYIGGRSTRTNALEHLKARTILIADIKDFFGSISRARVISLLTAASIVPDAAEALADILVRRNHIPLGLSTSPVLANAVCTELDARLLALVPGGKYTRYADDLAFSGPVLPNREAIEGELRTEGFLLAAEKYRLVRAGRGLYLTGLSLEDGRAPRVPREMKRRLVQDLHHAERGLAAHIGRRGYPSIQSGINKIHGSLQYLRGIERDVGDRLHKKWLKILSASGHEVTYLRAVAATGRPVLFVIDESVIDGPAGRLLVLALVAVEDVDFARKSLDALLEDRIAAPFPATAIDVLQKEGLHWNSLAPDDRTRATETLRSIPFRAFIAYRALAAEDRATYTAAYSSLLAILIRPRLSRYDGQQVTILAEENSKVVSTTLASVTAQIYSQLEAANSRRPLTMPVSAVVSKRADSALPLADLVLGIFADFARVGIAATRPATVAKERTKPGAQAIARYEQVRDRIRGVNDVDARIVFSRRRPFSQW